MKFHYLDIPAPLKGDVHSFWKMEEGDEERNREFNTMADGSPGLIFQHSEKGSFSQNKKPLPPLFLYGATTKPNTMRMTGEFCTIGVFFTPYALKTIFGIGANLLTDTCVDLSSLQEARTFHLLEKLGNSASTDEQMKWLTTFIEIQVQTHRKKTDHAVLYVVSEMMSSQGSLSLQEITSSLRLSERSLERKFKEHVGLSPKLFGRICRFQASLRQLQRQSYEKLSDIAFDGDYSDQSHFIRNFKEFAGISPYQFQKQLNAVASLSSHL